MEYPISKNLFLSDTFPAIGLIVGITVAFSIEILIIEKNRISYFINTICT